MAAIETLVSNQDNAYIDDPCTVRRTIFVPAQDVSPIDFDITAEQREALYQRGLQASQQFLKTWRQFAIADAITMFIPGEAARMRWHQVGVGRARRRPVRASR